MSKDKISDYSATANSNTDIGGINIDEGCAPSGINDAIRTLMKQLKDWQSGSQDVYIHPAGSASAPSITATGDTNTGLFFPAADTVGIATGGTERARVDSSGNLGLGVTPSAWGSSYKTYQLTGGSLTSYTTLSVELFQNSYDASGSAFKYITTAAATRYAQVGGEHRWFNAPSGTAGNAISFTQAMTLDASGRLGIGPTSPACLLDVQTTSGSGRQEVLRVLAGPNATNNGSSITLGSTQTLCGYLSGLQTASNEGALVFGTHSSGAYAERARIDSSGNLLVNTTTNPATGKLAIAGNNGVTGSAIAVTNQSGTSQYYAAAFYNNGNSVSYCGSISISGTTTQYATSSDYRLKENIVPLTGALATVAQLKPCTYSWKATGQTTQGFIAHELQEVLPDAVVGEKDAVDENGNPKYQGIDTSFLVATLTAAIQELNAKFEAYKAAHP